MMNHLHKFWLKCIVYIRNKYFKKTGHFSEYLTWWTSTKSRFWKLGVSRSSFSFTIFSGKPFIIKCSAFCLRESLYSCTWKNVSKIKRLNVRPGPQATGATKQNHRPYCSRALRLCWLPFTLQYNPDIIQQVFKTLQTT